MKERKKCFRRSLALVLIMGLVLQAITYVPKASAAAEASASGDFVLDEINVSHQQTLRDNGNGSYSLEITMDSGLSRKDYNADSTVSKNNYFTAQYSGYYLIELWGGAGGDGSDTDKGKGGTGGQGGHVYGKVFLSAGETLFYQLGGNGGSTAVEDEGGGVNGDGGAHGQFGSLSVGGGGGYSAIYKFPAAEFEQNYTDGNGTITSGISETDRTTKYIMIAGGGGGGGAGDGWSIFGDDPVGIADGGAGGDMSSASGQLVGDGYTVQGTYYAGDDGKSSGTSMEYIGHGGSNVPGAISETITGLIQSNYPNDWEGAANTETEGGAGGAGNMRGGAGGAGYCGGSGAVMTSLVSTYNIGGGGGGSSFIASSVGSLTADEQSKLGSNTSNTGGAVNIVFLGDQETSFLEDLTLSIGMSQYMTVSDVTFTSGDETTTSAAWDVENQKITGINLLTSTATVTITMEPVDGFAGGNMVPLFDTDTGLVCSSADDAYTSTLSLSDDCSYVNVPLSGVEVDVVNHTTNVEGQEFDGSDLHGDLYTSFDVSSSWKYDFIEKIEGYTMSGLDTDGKTRPTETTSYPVSITVTPVMDNGYTEVGEQVGVTTITKDATITILPSGSNTLNGNSVSYYKELTYDEEKENYVLTIHTDISSDLSASAKGDVITTAGNLNYEVETSGYYYIQAWGGDGGDGIENGGTGGAGGTGGYVAGYIYLEKGDKLTGSIADKGKDATSNESTGVSTGGGYSQIILEHEDKSESTIMIAGGGGGGGNGGSVFFGFLGTASGGKGEDAGESLSTEDSVHTGYNGNAGSILSGGGAGGDAGTNYRSTEVKTLEDIEIDTSLTEAEANVLSTRIDSISAAKPSAIMTGAIVITPLSLEQENQADIADYTLNVQLSNYFVLADSVEDSVVCSGLVEVAGEEATFTPSYTSIDAGGSNLLTISNIDPSVTEEIETSDPDSEGNVTTSSTRTASFVISVYLKPRSGFLGGNDVPVVEERADNADPTAITMQYTQPDTSGVVQSMNLEKNRITDYANVTIQEDNDWANSEYLKITTPAPSIVRGEKVTRTPGLYTWELPEKVPQLPTDSDWEDDYVVSTVILRNKATGEIVTESPLAPETTTTYTISAGLAPSIESPTAICIPAVDPVMCTKENTIYVLPRVVYELTNLETSDQSGIEVEGEYTVTVEADTVYTATLTAKQGYKLPTTISVTVSDTGITPNYTYNANTGELWISAATIGTNVVTITASGGEANYNLTYVYEIAPGGDTKTKVEQYKENTDFSSDDVTAFHESYIPPDQPVYDGYEFKWNWETADGKEPATMPAQNIWAIGTYTPVKQDLTIRYLEKNTEKVLQDPAVIQVYYKSEYSVTPVTIPGYNPEVSVIEGTMDALGKEVTFYYTASQGQLNITYVYGDTHATHSTKQEIIETGGSYSITSPTITGYTPDQTTVAYSDVTAEQVANGINVTVTYTPNTYIVIFDPNGGSVSETSREVVYNKAYQYKADTTYADLPTPQRTGYSFAGWYLNDTKVTADTTVTTAADHTLVAEWENTYYTVSVVYIYEDGSTAATTVTQQVAYGSDYSISSPTIEGYTPAQAVITGTMAAANRRFIVTYISNYHTLTIQYLYGPDEGDLAGTPAFDPVELKAANNTSTEELIPPALEDYTPSPSSMVVQMGAEDKTVTFYYTKETPVVSVTVEWGDLTYEYDYGTWIPETHEYSAEPIEPVTAGDNYVKVTNNTDSNIPVTAALDYTADSQYTSITAYFTTTDSRTGLTTTSFDSMDPGDEDTAYLWLQGTLEQGLSETIQSGTCTVTITGGG